MNRGMNNLKRLGQLMTLCDNESDKGLVLSLASLIETTIQEIIIAFLVDNEAKIDLLPSPRSPIARRTKLACSLGLISVFEMNSILKLCSIRNEFAHSWDSTFATPKIKDDMAKAVDHWLKFPPNSNQKFREKTHRELFLMMAFMLLTDLVHRAEEVSKFQLKPIEWERTTWQEKMDE